MRKIVEVNQRLKGGLACASYRDRKLKTHYPNSRHVPKRPSSPSNSSQGSSESSHKRKRSHSPSPDHQPKSKARVKSKNSSTISNNSNSDVSPVGTPKGHGEESSDGNNYRSLATSTSKIRRTAIPSVGTPPLPPHNLRPPPKAPDGDEEIEHPTATPIKPAAPPSTSLAKMDVERKSKRPMKKRLHRFTKGQIAILETHYHTGDYWPSREIREKFGRLFGCDQRKVQVWFQNQRAKMKSHKKTLREAKRRNQYMKQVAKQGGWSINGVHGPPIDFPHPPPAGPSGSLPANTLAALNSSTNVSVTQQNSGVITHRPGQLVINHLPPPPGPHMPPSGISTQVNPSLRMDASAKNERQVHKIVHPPERKPPTENGRVSPPVRPADESGEKKVSPPSVAVLQRPEQFVAPPSGGNNGNSSCSSTPPPVSRVTSKKKDDGASDSSSSNTPDTKFAPQAAPQVEMHAQSGTLSTASSVHLPMMFGDTPQPQIIAIPGLPGAYYLIPVPGSGARALGPQTNSAGVTGAGVARAGVAARAAVPARGGAGGSDANASHINAPSVGKPPSSDVGEQNALFAQHKRETPPSTVGGAGGLHHPSIGPHVFWPNIFGQSPFLPNLNSPYAQMWNNTLGSTIKSEVTNSDVKIKKRKSPETGGKGKGQRARASASSSPRAPSDKEEPQDGTSVVSDDEPVQNGDREYNDHLILRRSKRRRKPSARYENVEKRNVNTVPQRRENNDDMHHVSGDRNTLNGEQNIPPRPKEQHTHQRDVNTENRDLNERNGVVHKNRESNNPPLESDDEREHRGKSGRNGEIGHEDHDVADDDDADDDFPNSSTKSDVMSVSSSSSMPSMASLVKERDSRDAPDSPALLLLSAASKHESEADDSDSHLEARRIRRARPREQGPSVAEVMKESMRAERGSVKGNSDNKEHRNHLSKLIPTRIAFSNKGRHHRPHDFSPSFVDSPILKSSPKKGANGKKEQHNDSRKQDGKDDIFNEISISSPVLNPMFNSSPTLFILNGKKYPLNPLILTPTGSGRSTPTGTEGQTPTGSGRSSPTVQSRPSNDNKPLSMSSMLLRRIHESKPIKPRFSKIKDLVRPVHSPVPKQLAPRFNPSSPRRRKRKLLHKRDVSI